MNIKIVRINLINPIKRDQFVEISEVLKIANKSQSLIINMGDHNFYSLEDLKFYKIELTKLQKEFEKFNKVAFFHTTSRLGQTYEHDSIQLFSNEVDAINWINK